MMPETLTVHAEHAATVHDEHAAVHALPGAALDVDKMPAHWLFAQLGKRVLRPGGLETTEWLLGRLRIGPGDRVVELAPGLGVTAARILQCHPSSYVGVDRDPQAAAHVGAVLARAPHGTSATVALGQAADIPVPDAGASVVLGEAMLSMQTATQKAAIFAEVARALAPGGRYGIHELALVPDDLPRRAREAIEADLSRVIRVGVRMHTVAEWVALVEGQGLRVTGTFLAPMRLLEPDRMIADEGVAGFARFVWNAARWPAARRRLFAVRAAFRRHMPHLRAIGLVAERA
jgi:SAM-dependent methyltransferase